jgi:enoyl-CoA hydratase/carnithine racemase
MSEDSVLVVENDGGVRILTMRRPEKLNALNTSLTESLRRELEAADASKDIHALVLTGAGRAFCAGADTGEFKDLKPENQHLVHARADLTVRVHCLFRELRKPIISAVRGAAVGGGAGLAIGCDMMVAGEDVKFGYPELKHGLVPAVVMTNLVRQLGLKLAFELVSTGRLLTAAELFELRLANRVVPPEKVVAAAIEIAQLWARAAPQAMSATKSLFYRVAELPFEAGMAAGRDVNIMMRGFSRDRNG